MINKLLKLRNYIPDELIDESPYGLVLTDREETVLVLNFEKSVKENEKDEILFGFEGCHIEKFSRKKNETKFFFKKVSANGTSEFPSVFLSYSDINENEDYFSTRKKKGKFIKILQKYPKEKGIQAILTSVLENSALVKETILEKMEGRKSDKELYILTITIDDKYVGESELFDQIRADTETSLLSPYYTLSGNKEFKPKDKACSVCLMQNKEVWGYVSTFNFYTAKTEFAPIAGGFNKSDAWKNYPVCPDCAVKLKEAKSVIENYMKYYFCGFSYFLVPEFINNETDNADIMEYFLDRETAIGKFSLNEDRNLITNSKDDILDIIKGTDNRVNYTMFFFEANNNEFKILLAIEDVYPSQFKMIFSAKDKAENFSIFKNIENKKEKSLYDLAFRFNFIKEFIPLSQEKSLGNLQVFKKNFLEITRAVFLQKNISYKFLLNRIVESIRRKFSNGELYLLSILKIILTLKFFNELGIIDLTNDHNEKEVFVDEIYQVFFNEHLDFFDSSSKKAVFLEGVLCQKLLNIQYQERKATPFRTKLNGLKMNPKVIKRLLPEMIEKLEQYKKNHFYLKLETTISKLLLESKLDNLSNDEISFYFVMGMNLHKEFKRSEKSDSTTPEQTESEIV